MKRKDKEAQRTSRRAANMQNKQAHNPAQSGTAESGNHYQKKNLFKIERHEVPPMVFEGVGVVLFGFLANLFSDDHKVLSCFFAYGAVLCLLATPATRLASLFTPSRVWRVYWLCAVVLGIFCSIIAYGKAKAFSVTCSTMVVSHNPYLYRVLHNDGDGLVLTPSPTLMFVQLTSLMSERCMIDSYAIDSGDVGTAKWETVKVVRGQLFQIHEMDKAAGVGLDGNDFNEVIFNRNIDPKATVQGWILLDSVIFQPDHFRMRIRDTLGNDHTCLIKKPKERLSGETAIQLGRFRAMGQQDLRGVRELPYLGKIPKGKPQS